VLTGLLIVAGLAGVPPLSDPVAGTSPASLHLRTPELYLILAPLFSLWDGVSMLSMSRLGGFLTGLALIYVAWRVSAQFAERSFAPLRMTGGVPLLLARRQFRWRRELGLLVLSVAALLGFVLLGALWHRPMLSLAGVSPGDLVVDFHSHTNLSHDVADTWMRGFDTQANLRWHTRAGFDLAFITDHNLVEKKDQGAGTGDQGPEGGDRRPAAGDRRLATVPCPGIEVSAWRAHIVLLGDTLPVDRSRYNGSLEELLQLLDTSESAYGSLTLASLPEYRRNHWSRLDTLIAAGVDGLEIVNASPKANELTRVERDRVIALARAHNRFVAGVSDSHGWGATSMVWNLVKVPPPPGSNGASLCRLVLQRLRSGFPAVRVVERHRLRPDAGWPIWLTPVGVLWETWRSMGWAQTASWIVWVWLGGFLLRRRPMRGNIT
jgi:hypothetical protein